MGKKKVTINDRYDFSVFQSFLNLDMGKKEGHLTARGKAFKFQSFLNLDMGKKLTPEMLTSRNGKSFNPS